MADFRVAYSHLIKAIWADPSMEQKVAANPQLLSSFGFAHVPPQVNFAPATGPDTVQGFNQLKSDFDNTANKQITFYIPSRPAMYHAPTGSAGGPVTMDTCCCCCSCPCCCCT